MADGKLSKIKQLFLSMVYFKQDNNSIGSTGTKWLIKTELPLLELLQLGSYLFNLGGCQLGSEGVKQLPKGYWPNLSYL